MSNPYRDAEDCQFWGKSVTWVAPGMIDPVSRSAPILASDRVSTLGSCFAQHIARHLASAGANYYVPEHAPVGLSADEAMRRNYGVFSARYGNVYTVQQALQLFKRAFGAFHPRESAWRHGDVFVDPFRPRIEPEGFPDIAALEASRRHHLRCVQDLFRNSDWIVFTLGLTEAWRDRRDGAVFPLAPGVHGGAHDPAIHEFVNFTIDEVRAQLFELIGLVFALNRSCRILLTVSPVPLIATFEKRHVLSSTVLSKSVLRVAADEAERRYENVFYFPSYEIITSPATAGLYYDDDLRQVREIGVRHVMRVFSRHFLAGGPTSPSPRPPSGEPPSTTPPAEPGSGIVCDEETIARSLAAYR